VNQTVDLAPIAAGALFVWLIIGIAMAFALARRLLGPEIALAWSRGKRLGFVLLAWAIGLTAILQRIFDLPDRIAIPPRFNERSRDVTFEATRFTVGLVSEMWARGLALLVGVLLAVKLYEKWIEGRTSDAERSAVPGESMRAWLGGSNLFAVLLISLCAWYGFDVSFWFVLMIGLGALAAYPLFTAIAQNKPPIPVAPTVTESLSPERERVLKLLEQGKITAEESAELLGALAATIPPPPPLPTTVEPMTPTRKLLLAGAALVLVGFFLPWFKVDIAAEAKKLASAMQQQMFNMTGSSGMPMPGNFNTSMKINGVDVTPPGGAGGVVVVTGGDVGHALGWIVLLLGLAAAVTPYVATGLRRDARWKVMLAAIGIALVIAIYLLTGMPSAVSVGLPVVLVGLVLEAIAVLRGEREPAVGHAFPVVTTPLVA
jgi:hypothetical protein